MDDIKVISEMYVNTDVGKDRITVSYDETGYHLYAYEDGERVEVEYFYYQNVLGLVALPKVADIYSSGLRLGEVDITRRDSMENEDDSFKEQLDDILLRIKNKYPYVNGDPVNDKLQSLVRGDFEYDDSSNCGGYYEPLKNSIHISESNKFDDVIKYHSLCHELLHFSTTPLTKKVHLVKAQEGDERYQALFCGFDDVNKNYQGLNEGTTEYLTSRILGDDPIAYPGEVKFVKMLIALSGNDVDSYAKKYFDCDTSIFEDIIGDADKAFRFAKCIDMMSLYDSCVVDQEVDAINEQLFVRACEYGEKQNLPIHSFEDLEEYDQELANTFSKDVYNSFFDDCYTPDIEKVSFVSDAENILLDVLSKKLDEMEENKSLDDEYYDFFYDFASNFIFYDDILEENDNLQEGIFQYGIYNDRFLNMEELKKSQVRFREIMAEHDLEDVFDFYLDWSKGRKQSSDNEEGIEEVEEIFYVEDENDFGEEVTQLITDDDFAIEENDQDDEDELE